MPWEELTMDRLSEDSRKLIAKMARATARDFFEDQREEWRAIIGADLDARVESAVRVAMAKYRDGKRRAEGAFQYMDGRDTTIPDTVAGLPKHTAVIGQTRQGKAAAAAERRPVGNCTTCGAPWTDTTAYTGSGPAGGAWHHVYPNDCTKYREAKALSREGRAAGMVVPVPPTGTPLPDNTMGMEEHGCFVCGLRWVPGTRMVADGVGGWSHRFSTECGQPEMKGSSS
jgi:hypothetical protein